MANTLKFKRGLVAGIPTAALGEPLFTTDTFDLYIGNGTGNTRFQKYIASGTTSQLLRGDGSLLTMPIVLTSPSTGQVLKYNGTSWVNDSDAGITGSGAAGQVAYFTGATTQSGSNNLFWDNANIRLGIGTNTPNSAYLVTLSSNTEYKGLLVTGNTHQLVLIESTTSARQTVLSLKNGGRQYSLSLNTNNTFSIYDNTAAIDRLVLHTTGNLHLGGTSDNGLRFQVTGDGSFSGYVTATNLYSTGASNFATSGGNVGIGTSSPIEKFTSNGLIATTGASVTPYYIGNNNGGFFDYNSGDTRIGSQISSGSSKITFHTTSSGYTGISTKMTLDASGNLGLGITSIQDKLDVNGAIRFRLNTSNFTSIAENGVIDYVPTSIFATTPCVRLAAVGSSTVGAEIRFLTGTSVNLLERMRLDASGNLGLGVTPSAWGSSTAMQIGSRASIASVVSDLNLSNNAFFNGTSWIYLTSTAATNYYQSAGEHVWRRGAGGTAGNAITWTIPMKLTDANNLLIGTTTDAGYRLDVNGTMRVSGAATFSSSVTATGGITSSAFTRVNLNGSDTIGAGAFTALYNTAYTTAILQQLNANNGLDWWTLASGSWTKRMTLDASGNLGLGVVPSAWSGYGVPVIEMPSGGTFIGQGSVNIGSNWYYSGSSFLYKTSSNASYYSQNSGQHRWFNAPSGTAGNAITFTQAMTLHSTGNLAIGTGAGADAGFRLDVNGTMRVSGASTFGGLMTISGSATTLMQITSTGSAAYIGMGDSSGSIVYLGSDDGSFLVQTPGSSFSNKLVINSAGAATFSSSVTVASNLTVDTNTLFVDATNNRVGIGTVSPTAKFDVFGTGLQLGSTSYYYNTRIINNNNSGLLLGGDNSTSVGLIAGINEIAFVTYGGAGWTEKVRLSGDGNLGIANLTPSYKLDVTGEARVSNAIAIGTTPDTNKPFKVLKNINGTVGINFENTSTGSLAFSAIQMGTDVTGGTKFTNIVYSSSGVAQSGVYYPDGTSIINIGTGGLNFYSQGAPIRMFNGGGNGVLKWEMVNDSFINHYTGTAPTTSATDGYRQYSADVVAGNAAPHFRTENGAVIKLYQETTGVGNAIFSQGGGNSVLDDSTFDGYTLRQIVKALRNQGILA